MNRILIVEDDEALGIGLRFDLETEHYLVTLAGTAEHALLELAKGSYHLILLDVNLPDGNGFSLCERFKKIQDIPVIFLTACDLETDQLKGFDAGADDYITKPFSMPLLRKRVAAVLKRGEKQAHKQYYNNGHLLLGFDSLDAVCGGEAIVFTPTEYKLLKLFIANAGSVLTRQVLLEKLWGNDGNFVDEHTLTVNINRLRTKIERDEHKYIKTVYGMGYQWSGERL
ncbi:MAG: response regulator transcription factor [Clostridia bacterium]